jgi:hypothetical protein
MDINVKKFRFSAFNLLCVLVVIVGSVLQLKYGNSLLCYIKKDGALIFCQSTGSIIAILCTVLGVSISVQSNEYYGVRLSKFYELRTDKHHDFLIIILISIFAIIANVVTYTLNLYTIAIAISLGEIIYCINVALAEIPLIVRNDGRMTKVVGDYRFENKEEKEKSKVYLTIIENYLVVLGINDTYKILKKNGTYKDYNKEILFEILEIGLNLVESIEEKYNEDEACVIAHKLLDNVNDIMCGNFEDNCIFLENSKNYIYYVTHYLFSILRISRCESKTLKTISYIVYQLMVTKSESAILNVEVLISVAVKKIKEGDFKVIKYIRNSYSEMPTSLYRNNNATLLFAILSMEIYYLHSSVTAFQYKNEIYQFLNNEEIYGEQRYFSWADLFNFFQRNVPVDFKTFIDQYSSNKWDLVYSIEDDRVTGLLLTRNYIVNWFMTIYLNNHNIFDFDQFITDDESVNAAIIEYYYNCFDNEEQFVPTNEMKEIIEFFQNEDSCFTTFLVELHENNSFKDLVMKLSAQKTKKEIQETSLPDNNELEKTVRNKIDREVESEYGIDRSIDVNEGFTCKFRVRFEKYNNEDKLEDEIVDYVKEHIFELIHKQTEYDKVYNDTDLEKNINKIFSEDYKEIELSENVKQIIGESINENLNEKDVKFVKTSNILRADAIIKDRAFRFNLHFEKFTIREMGDDEVFKFIQGYKRNDGQYYYEDRFASTEDIIQIAKKKFIIISVSFKFNVISNASKCHLLLPFSK